MTVLKEDLNLYSKFVRKQGFQPKAEGSEGGNAGTPDRITIYNHNPEQLILLSKL